jgi:asparagine synthase (glutamine-hydrolysing)
MFDHRIIEFCLAAPGSMKVGRGYSRYMIRKAMDGLLPPRIQWRTTKQPFSGDYPARYTGQLEKVREFLRSITPKDPVRTIVDVDLLKTLVGINGAAPDSWEAVGPIPMSIYLICFLRQFSEFRR